MIRRASFFVDRVSPNLFMAKHKLSFEAHLQKPSKDQKYFFIDGRKCDNKINLYKHFSHVFNFSDYFGNNWDAFADSISDYNWFKTTEFKIFIINPIDILKQSESDRKIFWEILSDLDEIHDPQNSNEEPEYFLDFILQVETSESEKLEKLLSESQIPYKVI